MIPKQVFQILSDGLLVGFVCTGQEEPLTTVRGAREEFAAKHDLDLQDVQGMRLYEEPQRNRLSIPPGKIDGVGWVGAPPSSDSDF